MCERYVLPSQDDVEREFMPAQRWWKFMSSFNVSFPQYVPAIRAHERATEGVMMRWGLIPAIAEGIPLKNERPDFEAELLGQTPESREPWLNSQRCILPAAGFYAWQLTEQRYRQPYFFGPLNRTVFGIAAYWDRSVTEEDDVFEGCSIITVPANSMVERKVGPGSRMPAILHRKDYSSWLTCTPVQAKAMLRSYSPTMMLAHPVSPRVNSTKYNDATLIRPLA